MSQNQIKENLSDQSIENKINKTKTHNNESADESGPITKNFNDCWQIITQN